MPKRMTMEEFLGDFKGGGDILKWKEDGKAIIVLHPESEIVSRFRHPFPVVRTEEVEGKKGKVNKVKKLGLAFFNCPSEGKESTKCKCGVCRLRAWLAGNDDVEDDDVVLELEVGKETAQYTKGDIIGEDGFDWKKNLRAKKEYVFGCVNAENDEKAVVLIGAKTLGKRIKNVIADQIEDVGEDKGNPFTNPYPIKITFDSGERGSDMYDASFSQKKITKEIQKLLDGEAPDIEPFLELPSQSDVDEAIEEAIIIKYEGTTVEGGEDEENEKPKKPKESKKPSKDDDEEGKKKPKKKKKKKKAEPEPEPEPEPEKEKEKDEESYTCPVCSADVEEDDDSCDSCGTEFE